MTKYRLAPNQHAENFNLGPTRFEGTLIITDPCYLMSYIFKEGGEFHGADWVEEINKRVPMLCAGTIYGDWGCGLFTVPNFDLDELEKNPDSAKFVAEFCADAGLVCVCTAESLPLWPPSLESGLGDLGAILPDFKGIARLPAYTTEDGDDFRIVELEHDDGTKYLGKQTDL